MPSSSSFAIGGPYGKSDVWNAVVSLSGELTHAVTGQPYRMPGRSPISQEQRLYHMVKEKGVEAAIERFNANGKTSAWGGTNWELANQLVAHEFHVFDTARRSEFFEAMNQTIHGSHWILATQLLGECHRICELENQNGDIFENVRTDRLRRRNVFCHRFPEDLLA